MQSEINRDCRCLISPFWWFSVLLSTASIAASQPGPPSPDRLEQSKDFTVSESELAFLAEKVSTEEIPLLPGFNLVSLPEETANTDPASVFAALGGQLERVQAYDACDLADPWKTYDPADPAGSDLNTVDHRMGLWVAPTVATILPSDGTLPATTTLELCPGWNLIGFPAGQSRHPLAVLSSIAGKWQRLFGYDAFDAQNPWEVFDPAVPAWANDLNVMQPGRGYWLLVTEAATLEIRNQGPPPTVAISTPVDLAVVTQPTEITGSVDSDLLGTWTLIYRAIGAGEAVEIASGNTPVGGLALGTFDPTLLPNGLYEIELTATDIQGLQVRESIAVAVEGQMKIGHFTVSFVDLAIPVVGLDIEVVRTYDSRDPRQGDFGIGWTLDIRQGSYRNNRPPGEGWQLKQGFLPCDTVLESKSHLTVVRLSDQEIYRFALNLHNGVPSAGGGCFADARFDFVDGPTLGATLDILGNSQVFWETGADQVTDVESLALFEPRQVRLTTRDGRIFDLDLTDGVTRVEDRNGNELRLTAEGITHSADFEVAFERDSEERIISITDPAGGQMAYTYNGLGDLVQFLDRVGKMMSFAYDDAHHLTAIRTGSGKTLLTASYDSDGRVEQQCDGALNCTELVHDLAGREERRIDPTGRETRFRYDARGNVTVIVDGLDNETRLACIIREALRLPLKFRSEEPE